MAKKSKKARKPGRPKAQQKTLVQVATSRVKKFYGGVVKRVKNLFSFITK